MVTTPLEREILAHYWVTSEPYKGGSQYWTPVVHDAMSRFVELGLFEKSEINRDLNIYLVFKNEDALVVYMEALGAVPLPVRKWVMP